MNKLKYIAYYSDPDETKSRKTEPSADTKADYIISALKAADYEVGVVSMCYEKNRVGLLKKSAAYVTEKTEHRFILFRPLPQNTELCAFLQGSF